jgi:16S rRNA (adenine1518-N6/adenine1519-N6)-dimethyltransferase
MMAPEKHKLRYQNLDPPHPRNLLRRFQLRPDKKLGQHFLVDQGALGQVVKAAHLKGHETVLEIGAGLGSLTFRLAQRADQVIAIEFDQRLIPALETVVEPLTNVRLIEADILELDLQALLETDAYLVVANIPYNITSTLIRRLMETPNPPARVVLTIQREVAERIVVKPGEMNLLALGVQVYGTPEIMARIPAGAFYPRPKVDSAVLRIDIHPQPLVQQSQIEPLFLLARSGFGHKRKQLKNALSMNLDLDPDRVIHWLEEIGLDPKVRAQALAIQDWVRLTEIAALEN